jgi:hypothetical protein
LDNPLGLGPGGSLKVPPGREKRNQTNVATQPQEGTRQDGVREERIAPPVPRSSLAHVSRAQTASIRVRKVAYPR